MTTIDPGGVGDTRMALRPAVTARGAFSGGGEFLDLAERHEANPLVNTVTSGSARWLFSLDAGAATSWYHELSTKFEIAWCGPEQLLDRATRARQPARGARLLLVDRVPVSALSTRNSTPFDGLTAKQRAVQPRPARVAAIAGRGPEPAAELDAYPQTAQVLEAAARGALRRAPRRSGRAVHPGGRAARRAVRPREAGRADGL